MPGLAVAKPKEPINPFYTLLVLLGIVFMVTASAYGTMAYRAISPDRADATEEHELMTFLDQHGIKLMGGEIILLAAATAGAMWLDGRRFAASGQQSDAGGQQSANSRKPG